MPRSTASRRVKNAKGASPLMVRLDRESRAYLTEAARLRRISVSDYVRAVTVAQVGARSWRRGRKSLA